MEQSENRIGEVARRAGVSVDERHIRDDLTRTGATSIPQRIFQLIREGLCACDSRNPAGVCCLGEVNRISALLKDSLSRNRA